MKTLKLIFVLVFCSNLGCTNRTEQKNFFHNYDSLKWKTENDENIIDFVSASGNSHIQIQSADEFLVLHIEHDANDVRQEISVIIRGQNLSIRHHYEDGENNYSLFDKNGDGIPDYITIMDGLSVREIKKVEINLIEADLSN